MSMTMLSNSLSMSKIFQKHTSWSVPAHCTFYSHGREAIVAGIGSLPSSSKKTILVPASLCVDALHAIIQAGYNVRYYALDDQLGLDLGLVEAEMSDDVFAIYTVHYYGFWQSLSALRAYCDAHKVYLVEDCAHCFWEPGPENSSNVPGIKGDIRIFSLWKFFPLPDGGLLEVASASASRHASCSVELKPAAFNAIWLLRLVWRKMMLQHIWRIVSPLVSFLFKRDKQLDNREILPVEEIQPQSISAFAEFLLKRQDFQYVSARRRENFKHLLQAVENLNWARPLYSSLPESTVPYHFPIVVKNAEHLKAHLGKSGVASEVSVNNPYKTLPGVLQNSGSLNNVRELHILVLSLPVHQDVTDNQMKKMVTALRTFL